MAYEDNNWTAQLELPCSLITAFGFRCLDSTVPIESISNAPVICGAGE